MIRAPKPNRLRDARHELEFAKGQVAAFTGPSPLGPRHDERLERIGKSRDAKRAEWQQVVDRLQAEIRELRAAKRAS